MDKKHRFTLHVNMDDFIPATDEEKSYIVQMRPSTTFFKDGVKRLCRNKVALVSLIVVAIITLSAILIPAFWPYSYDQQLGVRPGKPVDASFNNLAPFEYGKTELKRIEEGEKVFPHVFGTDSAGRDYFIRVVYGTRISLAVGFFASLIVLIIGMTVGSIAGYCGGKVDLIIMRIVDIIYSLPDTLMVILLATVLKVSIGDKLDGTPLAKIGSNIISLFIVFAVLYWVSMARLIRGQILSLREQEYVLAAQATGAKGRWIITRHLVPNCMSVIFISTALQIPNAIFTESFLSYLGGVRRAQRSDLLSLPHGHPGARHLAHRALAQPLRRRSARRVRPEAQRLRKEEAACLYLKYRISIPPFSPTRARSRPSTACPSSLTRARCSASSANPAPANP